MQNSLLLYNLYPRNNWLHITKELLAYVKHEDIIAHINIPKRNPFSAIKAYWYLKKNKKVKHIFLSFNLKYKGESIGFETFRKKVKFNNYDIVSYIHSKGSSRKSKNTTAINDWTELLRYFVVERLDLAKNAFESGYLLYGVNLKEYHLSDKDGNVMFPDSRFHYSGNFVTINLKEIRKEFLKAKCLPNYYGVEVFWGTLCDIKKAFCVHESNINHYVDAYPAGNYK